MDEPLSCVPQGGTRALCEILHIEMRAGMRLWLAGAVAVVYTSSTGRSGKSVPSMHVTFIGSGDAFGSGGRLNTCIHVQASDTAFLIDCGASSLIGMKRFGIERHAIDTILITHFHADHFGGVPFFMLDAQFNARRTRPLTIAGPEGLRDWFVRAMETGFIVSWKTKRKFDLDLIELTPGQDHVLGPLRVRAARVRHAPVDGPYFGYRIEADGKTIAFTGDTEWVENLVEIGRGADLFISECYSFDKKVPFHIDYVTLAANLDRIAAKRVILTHMNEETLARAPGTGRELAHDGLKIEV
jgi:ribonuclease BN (tRNA processing enzyme)